MKNLFRRLRGTLGNALVWAGAWFIATFPLIALIRLIVEVPPSPASTYLGNVMALAPTLAMFGFVSGSAFSLYLGIAGRDRGLNELKPGWIALATGVTVGLFVAAFLLILLVFFRDWPVSFGPITLFASIFGGLAGVTALGQVKIAQKALTPGEEGYDELDSGPERLLPDPEGEDI